MLFECASRLPAARTCASSAPSRGVSVMRVGVGESFSEVPRVSLILRGGVSPGATPVLHASAARAGPSHPSTAPGLGVSESDSRAPALTRAFPAGCLQGVSRIRCEHFSCSFCWPPRARARSTCSAATDVSPRLEEEAQDLRHEQWLYPAGAGQTLVIELGDGGGRCALSCEPELRGALATALCAEGVLACNAWPATA